MTKTIFLIAGEPSGDALGASLIKSIRATTTEDIRFTGIGGPLMEETGVFRSLLPMDELCVMGIWEVLAQLSRLKKLIIGITEEIEELNVDLVVTIDLPDFNFHLGKLLKDRQFSKARHIHYVAPSVWAWRPGRAPKIAGFLDGLMCLFPFEPQHFAPHNLNAAYVGHPMTKHKPENTNVEAFKNMYDIPLDAPTIGVFFGSRVSELKVHAPVLKEAIQILKEQNKDLQLIVPTLPQLEFQILQILSGLDCPSYVITNQDAKWDAFAACDAAVAVSGTVGLELAYAGVPHVICYKTHPVTYIIAKLLVKVKHAHLANIMMNREIVPELIQKKCTSLEIAKSLYRLMKSEKTRTRQKKGFNALRDMMALEGSVSPGMKAAQFVLSELQAPPRPVIARPKPAPKPEPAVASEEIVPEAALSADAAQEEVQAQSRSASLMRKIENAKDSNPFLGKFIDPLIEKYAAYQAKKNQSVEGE